MAARASKQKLLTVFEGWLRKEREERQRRLLEQPQQAKVQPVATPYMPSKHMAFFR